MKLGTNDIGSVYLGTNAVQKVYLGTNEVWSSFTGLLDTYTGAAAAYSLRKLRSAYTGSAIRVRRADNNAEQDIGFIGEHLDTSALTTFCSGTDGFVKTWYDQSGNAKDATQTTAESQPQIVTSGSVITENGKPTLQFDGVNDILNSTTVALKWVVAALNPLTAKSYESFVGYDNRHIIIRDALLTQLYDTGSQLFTPAPTNPYINNIATKFFSNSVMQLFSVGSDTVSQNSRIITIGDDNAGGSFSNQRISELVAYTDNQEFTNKNGISNNINTYYSIY